MKAEQKKLMTHTKLTVINVHALARIRGGLQLISEPGLAPPATASGPDIIRTPSAPVPKWP